MITSDDSTSSFTMQAECDNQFKFTELSEMSSNGYSLLVKAKRYGRWWVLKGLKDAYRSQLAYQTLLRKEFEMMVLFQHANIVSAVEWAEVAGIGQCIVMEWIDGVNLKQWLQNGPSLKERRRVAHQLIDALEYIHGMQLTHRDLKPSNIMITNNGNNVKLIDFGLSDTDSYAIFKTHAGTEGYIDPEGDDAGASSKTLSDIYSLGRVLSDLHLGWGARRIVDRCCDVRSRRYRLVEDVEKALRRVEHRPRYLLLCAMILALAAMTAISVSAYFAKEKSVDEIERLKQQHDIAMEESRHKQDTMQTRINSLESEIARNAAKESKTQKQIDDGKKLVDSICGSFDRDIGIYKSYSELSEASDKVTKKLWPSITEYCNSIDATDFERTIIDKAIEEYAAQRYTLKWMDIILQSSDNYYKNLIP